MTLGEFFFITFPQIQYHQTQNCFTRYALRFKEKFTRLKSRMFFEGSGKMRNGRISQEDGYFRHTEALFIQEITGMLHALTLVEIKYSRAEHFLEAFLKITFIDSYFPA